MAPCLSKRLSVCLETIFKHMPLGDLLGSVGLVCSSFYNSRLTELMRHRQLVVVEDEKEIEKLSRNFIHNTYETDLIRNVSRNDGSAWLTLVSVEQIKLDALAFPDGFHDMPLTSSRLSNITHLTLVFHGLSNHALARMILFIEHFSKHLTDLKLCVDRLSFRGDTDYAFEFVSNLFSCLNRLQLLRNLRLDLSFYLNPYLRIRPQLTFLSRLATFAVNVDGIEDPIGWILFSLHQYGGNVDSIELYNNVQLSNFLPIDHQLESKIKLLVMDATGLNDYDDMKRFCRRFSSLTTLKLFELLMPMTTLARCLSLLPQLVKLDLHIRLIRQVETQHDGEQPQPRIVQVPSVRLLKLIIKTGSHLDSETLFIPEIFPNLQVLRLVHQFIQCPICKIMHINHRQSSLIAECKRLTRQPFRRCANLHTITLDFRGNETLINVDEL